MSRSAPKASTASSTGWRRSSMDQVCQSASVTRPGELGHHVGQLGQGQQCAAPGGQVARGDGWSRQVVRGRPRGQAGPVPTSSGRPAARACAPQVEGQPGRRQRGQPASHVVAGQPGRVVLVVDAVAEPDEAMATGTGAQGVDDAADLRRGEVGPAHDTEHEGQCLRRLRAARPSPGWTPRPARGPRRSCPPARARVAGRRGRRAGPAAPARPTGAVVAAPRVPEVEVGVDGRQVARGAPHCRMPGDAAHAPAVPRPRARAPCASRDVGGVAYSVRASATHCPRTRRSPCSPMRDRMRPREPTSACSSASQVAAREDAKAVDVVVDRDRRHRRA